MLRKLADLGLVVHEPYRGGAVAISLVITALNAFLLVRQFAG